MVLASLGDFGLFLNHLGSCLASHWTMWMWPNFRHRLIFPSGDPEYPHDQIICFRRSFGLPNFQTSGINVKRVVAKDEPKPHKDRVLFGYWINSNLPSNLFDLAIGQFHLIAFQPFAAPVNCRRPSRADWDYGASNLLIFWFFSISPEL